MINYELSLLLRQYQNAETTDELLIKTKLDTIVSLYNNCKGEEFRLANELTAEFCRLIGELKAQQKRELDAVKGAYDNLSQTKDFVIYKNGEMLLNDFYRHFLPKKSSLTLTDYVNRIKTFSKLYLGEIYPDVATKNLPDAVLFTYDNLDYIIEHFKITENEKPIKQRMNIRSALKKLNEFKYSTRRG